MMGLAFFVAGAISVWHGFAAASLGYVIGGAVCWLLVLASWGMSGDRPRTSGMPPSEPPGQTGRTCGRCGARMEPEG